MIDENSQLSVRRQCRLLGITRSLLFYRPTGESPENLKLMELIDRIHLEDPSAGSRRLASYLKRIMRKPVGRKRVQRLMRLMGIEAVYPRKRTTIPGGPSGIQPYLLKGLNICRSNQVWSADITYVKMQRGYMYLFAIIDWFSRKIVAWELSNTLDTGFCVKCLNRAIRVHGVPEILNTDQGSQFTSEKWLGVLRTKGIKASMDGRGRWLDNVAIERFWRTIKYEDIFLKGYETVLELERGIGYFIQRYNAVRPHSALSGATPDEMYFGKIEKLAA